MAAQYGAGAGPSRQYIPPLPPPVPSKSASPNFSPDIDQDGRWDNPSGARSSSNRSSADNGSADDRDAGKRNPLVDLMDTEKLYVEQLGLVIRRVAAAWSRKDFPPPKLDTMFRCIETVYRANRAFGTKLKEIGPNPASPKAIGDLLMRWIDDLETPYRKYATTYLSGFDSYTPVTRNALLPGILAEISISNPPTPPLSQWSLDAFFLLPFNRLRYYRKLYTRLLRATKEGRSDHRLLVVANQRLETLIAQIESRLEMDVHEEDILDTNISPSSEPNGASREPSWQEKDKERQSRTSSAMDSSYDSQTNSPFNSRVDPRTSSTSSATSITQSPQRVPSVVKPLTTSHPTVITTPPPITDLELRIDPERAIDLFSMQPKKCKLQMAPAALPFSRFLRSSHDVTVYFTPNSTGQPVVHTRAHVFILSDLFLVAEWMDATDKAVKAQQIAQDQPERVGHGGPMPEMWLCYPPLAGKHLMVAEGDQANALNVMIMRKETFVIHAESDVARDQMVKDLLECIDFAASMSRRNTAAPSPAEARSPSSLSDNRSTEGHFPPFRYPSPFSVGSSPTTSPRPPDSQEVSPPMPFAGAGLASQMQNMSLEPGDTMPWGRGPSPPPPAMPQPQLPPPGGNALPPRGASLRTRAASGDHLPVPGATQAPTPYPPQSDPSMQGHPLPRSPSGRSVTSNGRSLHQDVPPVPVLRGPGSHLSDQVGPSSFQHQPPNRSRSADPLRPPGPIGGLAPLESPSARFSSFPMGVPEAGENDSPPQSPTEEEGPTLTGPAVISAQMKCKVFLKQSHQQWKALGAARLKLYVQKERNIKQLVVEADSSAKTMLISTIVLTDGVERVAKTGVAVEISDKGQRTGIIYMIQLRNENSAHGLFESLLAGSDRSITR